MKEQESSVKARKVSRMRKPAEMTLEQWQTILRKEFGREQDFKFKNIGGDPVLSEFIVSNPATRSDYRVAIRGRELGSNYCSCRDFAVNTLGTCKHIEFLLARLETKRGGKAALDRGFHPPYSEIYLRYGLERKVVFGAGTQCPEELKGLASHYFDGAGILLPEASRRFDVFVKEAARFDHELRLYDDALSFIAQVRDDARRKEAVDQAFPQGEESPAFKNLLKVPLYPYQCTGALFAARAGRCLIADDMGLGKTIQAIAAAEILARLAGVEKALVICPTSLKHQWKQEIEKFCGRSAEVVEGLLPKRAEGYASPTFFKITNYDVVHADQQLIRDWGPDLIILDEAQRIKNWKTRTAQSVKKLESEHAIVLTGTPLENRLEELHSIVEFVDRFKLGPSFRFLSEHQMLDEKGKVTGYRNLSRISQTLAPMLVRRLKSEVLKDLPERLEKKYFVPMTEQQMRHHTENKETVGKIVSKWRRMGFLMEKDQRILMIALQNMRMSCNSTYLLDQKTDFGVKADELIALLGEILDDKDAKVVVFSQWTRTHDLIVNRFKPQKWDHVFFHGGVPGKDRRHLVSRFKTDPACRVFLSTDAGGVGLNLQNACAVVNMDQPWNPAVLEQRIGRVHRLGQHRPVRVVNFIAQGTIEHAMLSVLDFKKSMFAGVLDGGQDEVFLGGSRLKRFMETVEKAVDGIPAAMPPATREDPGSVGETIPKTPGGKPEDTTPAPSALEQRGWTDLISAGLSFLEKLGDSVRAAKTSPAKGTGAAGGPAGSRGGGTVPGISSLIAQDQETGQPYLRLPVPQGDVLRKVADLLNALAGK